MSTSQTSLSTPSDFKEAWKPETAPPLSPDELKCAVESLNNNV